jgi:hypothetical protein
MRKTFRTFSATILCWTALCAPGALRSQAPAQGSINLPVRPDAGASYPSMRPIAFIEVTLAAGSDNSNSSALTDEIIDAEKDGWNCTSVSSYSVTEQGSTKRVPISAILPVGKGRSCNDRPIPAPVLILLNAHVDSTTNYVVSLVGLPNGKTVVSQPQTFPSATTYNVSIIPQGVPGESLTNGKTRDVGQLSVTYGMPFVGRSPVFVNTKDLFSTDSKDSNSAFAVTGGVEHGLFRTWYTPVQLSEIIQGNQVATSLSAVSNLSVSGLVPWYWTHKALNNGWIDAGITPEFSLAAQYTHRFAQQVTAKTPLLSEDDASVNPSLTIEPFYLFPDACKTYRGWIKSKVPDSSSSTSRQFCLGLQIDIGTWYLPLDKTKSGSQQVEGYGDVSILIPLSNFNFNGFQIVQKDNLLNSQLRLKYSDSVNQTNNYARSRQWTFGIEIMK